MDLGIGSGYLHKEGRLEKRNRRWGPLAGDGGGAPLRMRERALGAVRWLLAGARARANA